MKKILLLTVLILIVKPSFGEEVTELFGDYLGQSLPGEMPVVIESGIVSIDYKEHWAPRFSTDGNEVFWWTIQVDEDNNWHEIFKTMRRIDNRWAAPEMSPNESVLIYSPDDNRLYFGSKNEGDDLSFVEKSGDSWSELRSVGLVSCFPEI